MQSAIRVYRLLILAPFFTLRHASNLFDYILVSNPVLIVGRKNIFAPKPLPFGDARTFEVRPNNLSTAQYFNKKQTYLVMRRVCFKQLTLPEDDGITSSKRPPRNFVIKMKKAGAIRMEVLHRFLDNKQGLTNDCLTGKGELSPMVVSIPYYIFIVI